MKQLRIILIIGLANVVVVFLAAGLHSLRTPSQDIEAPQQLTQTTTSPSSATSTPASTPSSTVQKTTPKPAPKPTPTGTVATTQTTPPSPPGCIITISGKRYDVQPLRSSHPGGDIFVCGTDMTDVFFSQHNQKMLDRQMRQYLIP